MNRKEIGDGPHGLKEVVLMGVWRTIQPPFCAQQKDSELYPNTYLIIIEDTNGTLVADAYRSKSAPELHKAIDWLVALLEVYYG